MSLDDFLQRRPYNAAADFCDRNMDRGLGKKIAFTDGSRSLTYADLQDACCRFGSALRALGLHEENRVILILHDTVDYPVAFWGAIRAGIIPIPLNTLLTGRAICLYVCRQPRRCGGVPLPRWPARCCRFSIGCRICG